MPHFCYRFSVTMFVLVMAAGLAAAAAPHASPATKALPLAKVEIYEIGPINNAALLAEDAAVAGQPGIPLRFALPVRAKIAPELRGTTEILPDSSWLWRLRVRSPGAVNLNLGFTGYRMPEGGNLFLYTPDRSTVIGPFTAADNESHGELWTPILPGEEIVIELQLPSAQLLDQLRLELTSINHGYRTIGSQQKSGSCNVDVICPEGDGWREQIRSVAVISTGGSTFCTGFAVNNTALDATPYFMTAYHCSVTSSNAASLVTYWNYENSSCRTPGSPASGNPGDGDLSQFQTGSYFRAASSASDFTLVELDDPPNPDHHVYLAGWDRSSADSTAAIGIHHPSTDEKRISFENDATSTTSYLGTTVPGDGSHVRITDWDLGTTEPGSSGSPLFNQDHRIVGQLHGGYAACGNDDSDWYGRFSVSWIGGGTSATRLSDWLDPGNTGAMNLDGGEASDDFNVVPDPTNLSICSGADAVYDINVGQIGTFADPITLTAVGNPGTAGFSVNPVTPPGTSVLTLTGVTNGDYAFTVEGTDSATVHSANLSLNVAAGAPGQATLLTPADGAINQPVDPSCTWSDVPDFGAYEIEIATDAGFTTIVESATGLSSASYTPQSLITNTEYFWRARAVNGCGDGSYSTPFSFITLPAPGDCPLGVQAYTMFSDDFESGAAGWTHSGTGDTWALSSARVQSGANSYHATDPAVVSDQRLVSPAVYLPALATNIYLRYWNYQEIEDASDGCFDGSILEISINGGSTWTQLDTELATDPYDGVVDDGFENPLLGLDAWCGDPEDWVESVVDLTAYVGETAMFRFRLGSDRSLGREGWYLDDVQVISCGAVPVELMSFSVE